MFEKAVELVLEGTALAPEVGPLLAFGPAVKDAESAGTGSIGPHFERSTILLTEDGGRVGEARIIRFVFAAPGYRDGENEQDGGYQSFDVDLLVLDRTLLTVR